MKEIKATLNHERHSFPIAIVVSLFNGLITSALKEGALQRLEALGIKSDDILLVEVPGAVEIPFVANLIAQKNEVEVIIALGAVIRGETSHYDYVCEQVSQGCQRVMMDHNIPVVFGVLTTENEEQAWDRLGGKQGHNGEKAAESAFMMRFVALQLGCGKP